MPPIIVRIASTEKIVAIVDGSTARPSERNTRTIAANAAAFTPTLISAVTGVGAPSYTSGVHMWNGTAATLNAKPAPTRRMPHQTSSGDDPNAGASA